MYKPSDVSRTVTMYHYIKNKDEITDKLIDVWDLDRAIDNVLVDTQKEFIEYWKEGYTESELSFIFKSNVRNIKKRKQKIKYRICQFLNKNK